MNNLSLKNLIFRLLLPALLAVSSGASAQSAKELKEIFDQAESFYLYEEYELANQLYILLENPDNLNVSYKIGTCYLNITDEKDKAIPYLEAAVKDAAYDAKPSKFKEKRAPLDAWFYLAKAYMISNDLEKSLQTFQTFKTLAGQTKGKKGMANLSYVDQQIDACKNAIIYKENPVPITSTSLGPDFSQGSINENPAVSFDGNTIVFTERRGLVNVILFSQKIRGEWQTPRDITSEMNAGEDCSSCSLNSDGTELFLYKNDNFDGNIYVSRFVKYSWTPVEKLNKNINTKYYESHASVSSDGKKLYFTSNREGGQGGLDIYISEKDAAGEWGPSVNLGTTINTSYNEDTPFITDNDSLLYFCSEGHNSIGGYDNYRSRFIGSHWSIPGNLGYPVNSTDDDKFYQPAENGVYAYYSMKTDYKKREIFHVGVDVKIAILPAPDSSHTTIIYEKIDLDAIPEVASVDSSILIKNMTVNDSNEGEFADPDVLYYTVQVMALYNPVDVSYFKYIDDLMVIYNDKDKFYRYISGRCATREKASALRLELIRKGYPEDIFIKKVSK